ncbi:hypothetical protein GGF37_007481, partial [Kickxella alabastrina]
HGILQIKKIWDTATANNQEVGHSQAFNLKWIYKVPLYLSLHGMLSVLPEALFKIASSANWDHSKVFNLQSFIDTPRAKHSVLEFGYSPYVCLGMNLAWMNIMPILANILCDYDM